MELNWDNAKEWQEKANSKKEDNEPKWNWDCNFKLDFDGGLVSIESRFYPPHYQSNGDFWDGKMRVNVLGNCILEKEFKCDTLEQLQKEVESFTKHYKGVIKSRLS